MAKRFWWCGSISALLGCVFCLAAAGAAAAAQSLVVTTTADTDQTGVGQCAEGGVCTLREAVNQANMDTGDTIGIPLSGTPFTLNPSFGPIIVTSSMSITGGGAALTAISGGSATEILDIQSGGSLSLSRVTLEDGQESENGGAVTIDSGGSLTIEGDVISGNTAAGDKSGGGIEDDGALLVNDSTITGNHAGGYGGGIDDDSTSPLLISDTTFSDNVAEDGGGGLALIAGLATATVSGSAFSSDTATTGYGGGIDEIAKSTLTLSNSTVYANSAAVQGGGVTTNSPSINTLVNDTIADNTAPGGPTQIRNFGSATIENTIVTGSDPNCDGTLTDAGHNLDSGDTCGFSSTDGDQINTNPDLGPLQNNGGATDTTALLSGSPAINRGSNTGCPATDQRGVTRPQGGTCDIGAYESAPPTLSSQSSGGLTPSAATLTASASNADAVGATVEFEYGTSTSYGGTQTSSLPELTDSATAVSASLTGLKPDTTYHYRVIVQNPDGTVTGSDEQFTTPRPPNTFTLGKVKVSSKGVISVRIAAPDAGKFFAKATFTVRVKSHKHTFTYATKKLTSRGPGNLTLKLAVRGRAAHELKLIGNAKVTISITFTPTGGSRRTRTHKVTVKRSKKGKYS